MSKQENQTKLGNQSNPRSAGKEGAPDRSEITLEVVTRVQSELDKIRTEHFIQVERIHGAYKWLGWMVTILIALGIWFTYQSARDCVTGQFKTSQSGSLQNRPL